MKEDSHDNSLRDKNGHRVDHLGQLIHDPDCAKCKEWETQRINPTVKAKKK